METSPEVGALAAALAKAQAEIKGAAKDSDNPFFKSKYADLSSVWEACRTALTNHGIAVIQGPAADGAVLSVTTLLLHSSGQWARSTLSTALKDQSPQVVGSATTYLRRYGLSAMAGVAPHDDDDGNAAQGNTTQTPKGRDAQREAVRDQQRRVSSETGPYVERERAKIDTTTGEMLPPDPPIDPERQWAELKARMTTWTPQAQKAIPSDRADFLFPDPDAEMNRQTYIDGIREAAKRRGLSTTAQTDIKELFTGSRASQLAHVHIYVLRALWIEMSPEERGDA